MVGTPAEGIEISNRLLQTAAKLEQTCNKKFKKRLHNIQSAKLL